MKNFFLFSVFFFTFIAFGQNIKLKKNVVKVDDKEWIKYEGCSMFSEECNFLNDDSEIVIKFFSLNDPAKVGYANREGRVWWHEVKFLGTGESFEIQETPSKIAKILYIAKIYNEDKSFNKNVISKLVEKYGHNFSERYSRNSGQTIIINNETQRSSGVNISIGR